MSDLAEYKPRWSLLRQAQMWPLASRLDPEQWLKNFKDDAELKHALALLESFLFISSEASRRLFVHAVRTLSQVVVSDKASLTRARSEWAMFLDRLIVVRVTGEKPSDADSGFIFARLARDELGISEDRILPPENAIISLLGSTDKPVLFVDDFVGSGNQFLQLWQRKYPVGANRFESFESVSLRTPDQEFYYAPLICAWLGKSTISSRCPKVRLTAAHLINERYGVFHAQSVLWPEHLRPSASRFIQTVSKRAGIPEKNGQPGDWRGFCKMGLAIAFEHGTPDATLPIFTWAANDWKPLLPRT